QGGGTADPVLSPGEQAAQLLAEAREGAEATLAAARNEAVAIRAGARQEGLAAGRAEAAAATAAAVGRLQTLAEELAAHKPALYAEARSQVLELTLALVRKILGPLAAASPDAVVQVVERALQLLSDREQLTIRVHPDDLKVLLDAKPQLLTALDGIQRLTVVDDPSVQPGGCLVQTPTTEIDARLDTQLQELARSLRSL
ncbi:MAG TPA: FliH/SctL family protein, partial [Deferrisomatales bacterium]|nr:FliH/SctL family protein [Deferrisomatales bacterium]